jgi:hypothetical protein
MFRNCEAFKREAHLFFIINIISILIEIKVSVNAAVHSKQGKVISNIVALAIATLDPIFNGKNIIS